MPSLVSILRARFQPPPSRVMSQYVGTSLPSFSRVYIPSFAPAVYRPSQLVSAHTTVCAFYILAWTACTDR